MLFAFERKHQSALFGIHRVPLGFSFKSVVSESNHVVQSLPPAKPDRSSWSKYLAGFQTKGNTRPNGSFPLPPDNMAVA